MGRGARGGTWCRAIAEATARLRLRAQALDTARTSQDRLARIVETSPTGIVFFGSSGTVTLTNAVAERLLGIRRMEGAESRWEAVSSRLTDAGG